MKIESDHLQTMLTKSYGIQVDSSNRFRKTHERIVRSACENRSKAVSPQRFIVFRPNLVHVITSMT
ncbi:MAG: hypothetical protein ACRCXN_09150 [Bacteroidales bacterium]